MTHLRNGVRELECACLLSPSSISLTFFLLSFVYVTLFHALKGARRVGPCAGCCRNWTNQRPPSSSGSAPTLSVCSRWFVHLHLLHYIIVVATISWRCLVDAHESTHAHDVRVSGGAIILARLLFQEHARSSEDSRILVFRAAFVCYQQQLNKTINALKQRSLPTGNDLSSSLIVSLAIVPMCLYIRISFWALTY